MFVKCIWFAGMIEGGETFDWRDYDRKIREKRKLQKKSEKFLHKYLKFFISKSFYRMFSFPIAFNVPYFPRSQIIRGGHFFVKHLYLFLLIFYFFFYGTVTVSSRCILFNEHFTKMLRTPDLPRRDLQSIWTKTYLQATCGFQISPISTQTMSPSKATERNYWKLGFCFSSFIFQIVNKEK